MEGERAVETVDERMVDPLDWRRLRRRRGMVESLVMDGETSTKRERYRAAQASTKRRKTWRFRFERQAVRSDR